MGQRVIIAGVVGVIASISPVSGQDCYQWREIAIPVEPEYRRNETVIFDPVRNQTVIIGGWPYSDQNLGWDGFQWTVVALGMPPRSYAAASFDTDRNRIVLFGGLGYDNTAHGSLHGDTWEWDGISWILRATTGPVPRAGHCMAYDSERKVTVLFGGSGEYGHLGATWEWDGTSWALVNGEGPPPRSSFMCAFDKRRGVFVVFGGRVSESFWPGEGGDIWEWDGDKWSFRGDFPYQARLGAAMAYDEARGTCVVHGGLNADHQTPPYWLEDTIEWDGTQWKQVLAPFLPHAYHGMVYDSARKRMVVVGGIWTEDKLFELIRVDEAADSDGDCDADLADFAKLQTCIGEVGARSKCEQFDVDVSGEIDVADLAEWNSSMSGPNE